MQLLRWTLVGCLSVGLASLGITSPNRAVAARLADASNKDKIIGVWEITKGGDNVPKGAIFEFTKDGKLKMTAKIEERTVKLEATYKVEGDKLKTAMTGPDGKKVEDTDTIEKLTDADMVLKDSKGKIVEFKKKKKEK